MREWRLLLLSKKAPCTIVDFGCGEGQYIVPFTKQINSATFIGADYHLPSVELMNQFGIANLSGQLFNLETDQLAHMVDIGLCVGVLQYISEDELALKNMYLSLKKEGKLLLYVPINGIFLTKVYPYIFQRFEQYESVNNRKRVYTENELLEKVERAGFTVRKKIYTYGTAGKLSHELLNSCTTLIVSGSYLFKSVAGFCLILFYPIILLLMMMDFISKKSNGNGLLLILEK
ncbi:MAG: methyltransferase domain-containing protein [Chitinophagaceae bacterium]|nr:methyltransferase domain-containing protein [Chitinophagaceae bacterium]